MIVAREMLGLPTMRRKNAQKQKLMISVEKLRPLELERQKLRVVVGGQLVAQACPTSRPV